MADWARLGNYVVARRIELGYKTRQLLSEASGISPRILGDIETGRRGRFDPKTLAALENTLGWAVGSAERIANGDEPVLVPKPTPTATSSGGADEALARVMRSNLVSDDQKQQIIRILIAEREAAERRRVEHADELIRLLGEQGPSATH